MTLVQYQTANNAVGSLKTAITSMATQFVMNSGEGALFPDPASGQYWLCMEQWNVSGQVTKRELRLVTAKTTDTFTANRAADSVPIAYDSYTQATTALSFDPADGPVTIRMTTPKAYFKNIIDELVRIEAAKLNLSGGSMTGQLKEAKATNTASASTVDLGALAGNLVHITGTTTISSFGTTQAGTEVDVVFDGILTLTYNATSMILPSSGSNIITAVGDSARFRSEGSGNWKCINYTPINGQSLVVSSAEATKKSYTAGEAISAGEHLRMGVDSIAEVKVFCDYGSLTTGGAFFGYNTTFQYAGCSFTTLGGPSGKQLKSVSLLMMKTGSPVGNITLKIYSNTGSTLIGTSSNTIAEASLSSTAGQPSKVTFTFPAAISLSNSTTYYLRIETTRANDTNNFSSVVPTNGNYATEYAGGQTYTINSGNSWNANSNYDWNMQVNINYNEDTTRVYKTSAFYEELCDAIGVADGAGTAGNLMTVDTAGVNDNQTVASGTKYYLSDTAGAISTTPGTNRVEAGVGDGTTRIRLSYQKDFRKKQFFRIYKDNSEVTVTKKYYHDIGRKVSRISFDTSGQNNSQKSSGFYDAAKNQQFACFFDGSAVGFSDTKSLQLGTAASGQTFTITAVDDESFTGTWTKAGSPTQVWHVFATIE